MTLTFRAPGNRAVAEPQQGAADSLTGKGRVGDTGVSVFHEKLHFSRIQVNLLLTLVKQDLPRCEKPVPSWADTRGRTAGFTATSGPNGLWKTAPESGSVHTPWRPGPTAGSSSGIRWVNQARTVQAPLGPWPPRASGRLAADNPRHALRLPTLERTARTQKGARASVTTLRVSELRAQGPGTPECPEGHQAGSRLALTLHSFKQQAKPMNLQ